MANNEKKTMLKEAAVLFGITLIAGILLGFVYELTKEPIKVQQENAITLACNEVFKEAFVFNEIEYNIPTQIQEELSNMKVTIGTVYEAIDANNVLLGYVIRSTTANGYAGNITLYVGITIDKQMNGISILSISETPGLGMRAEEVLIPQFREKEAVIFGYSKTGSTSLNQIDAISGATVTTKAVVEAINGAVLVVTEDLLKGVQ